MAASDTGSNFSRLCSNLYVDNQSDISLRYKEITKRLNVDFWGIISDTSHSRYVGSYGRDTAIRDFHDLDVLFELPASMFDKYDAYSGNKQSSLLQAVRASVRSRYSSTDVGGDGQVVVVNFSDGMRFEILPAFRNPRNDSYTYPDSNNGGFWKLTYPFQEIAEINSANTTWSKNLKRLCRMVRAWRRKCDIEMSGLLIDTFAYEFMKGWENKNKSFMYYDWMTRDFFKYLSAQDKNKQHWLAPGSHDLVWRKGPFESAAAEAHSKALEAIELDYKDYKWAAATKWREIYGNFYPNPG